MKRYGQIVSNGMVLSFKNDDVRALAIQKADEIYHEDVVESRLRSQLTAKQVRAAQHMHVARASDIIPILDGWVEPCLMCMEFFHNQLLDPDGICPSETCQNQFGKQAST